jgi:Ran GTPase-activating protein (RanGAP) involved in mRNA processing and transport
MLWAKFIIIKANVSHQTIYKVAMYINQTRGVAYANTDFILSPMAYAQLIKVLDVKKNTLTPLHVYNVPKAYF